MTPIERLETNRATAYFCWAMSGPVIPINIAWSLSQDNFFTSKSKFKGVSRESGKMRNESISLQLLFFVTFFVVRKARSKDIM